MESRFEVKEIARSGRQWEMALSLLEVSLQSDATMSASSPDTI